MVGIDLRRLVGSSPTGHDILSAIEKVIADFFQEYDNVMIFYYCDFINQKYEDLDCFIMKDSDNDYRWLVILPKNVSKLSTLTELGNILDVKKEEMVFFGDGPNDIEVISSVGVGVAMDNAIKEVKEKAKYVTLSNNNCGVSHFLEKKIFCD